METDYNMYYESNDDIFNNYEVRESIIREMAEQELWDSVESVPEDLLEHF